MRTTLAVVAAGLLAAAGCGSTATPSGSGDAGGGEEPPLVGTEWQLASYRDSVSAGPVAVDTDSTLRFDGRGHFSAHACNYIGGDATISGARVTFKFGMSTSMACTGEAGTLERQVVAVTDGPAGWSIGAGTLTLTAADGHVLTYRVRPSIYPDLDARTIVAGEHGGGQFRLAVGGPAGGDDHRYLVLETRVAPGESWGTAGVAAPGPGECLANSVTGGGPLGGDAFLAAWATPDVARVTTRAAAGSPETALTFYDVPGTTLRVAGLWTADFRPGASPVTFYGRDGGVISAYPDGPC